MWKLDTTNGNYLIKNQSSFGKKVKFHELYEYNKSIRDSFHSRPAFAKYAKMSVSLQKLSIKKSRAVTWCQWIPIH